MKKKLIKLIKLIKKIKKKIKDTNLLFSLDSASGFSSSGIINAIFQNSGTDDGFKTG